MDEAASQVMLVVHIALGFCAFVLGAVAVGAPKFGRANRWHRWPGRAYALCMVGMAALSVPLSLQSGNRVLLIIGLLTLVWAAGGWIAIRLALRVRRSSRHRFAGMLRMHVVLMGSSYIAAWTAFLVNVRPLGGGPSLFWLYALGPTVIGTVFITRATARVAMAS